MKTQKELVKVLDQAAQRAEMVGAEPASSKQTWYLAGLLLGDEATIDEYLLNSSKVLTRREASRMIDILTKEKEMRNVAC